MPPVWDNLRESLLDVPEGSRVPQKQEQLVRATRAVLEAIASDVRGGLIQTVGIESYLSTEGGLCSVVLELPEGTDTHLIARAVDAENVEAWRDDRGMVHVGINPWCSTKDVDQTVLSAIKIIHVLLGIHASEDQRPKSLKQRILNALAEVLQARNAAVKKR